MKDDADLPKLLVIRRSCHLPNLIGTYIFGAGNLKSFRPEFLAILIRETPLESNLNSELCDKLHIIFDVLAPYTQLE